MANYLTRAQIVDKIDKIEKLGPKLKKKQVLKLLDQLVTQAQVPYHQNSATEGLRQRIREVVGSHQGITFRELAEALDVTSKSGMSTLRTVVRESDEFDLEVMREKRGAFGKKPYGIYLA